MRKSKLVKKMCRRWLSGLLCVVLTAGSVMPMELQVSASEAQTKQAEEESLDAEENDFYLMENKDSVSDADAEKNVDTGKDTDLGDDSAKTEEDEAETVETKTLSEEDVETQVNTVDSAESDNIEEADKRDEAIESEAVSTTQVQSPEIKDEEADKADVESTEMVDDAEYVEIEESEESLETESEDISESEIVEEEIDNKDFTSSGNSTCMSWTAVENSSGGNTLTVTITKSGASYGECTWVGNLDMDGVTEAVLKSNSASYKIKSTAGLFSDFPKLQKVTIDNSFNATELTDTSKMFSGCNSLSQISNWSKISGSNVTNMSGMFADCYSLTSVGDNFNTTNVTNMSNMFSGCIDLSNVSALNTSKVINMSGMFSVGNYYSYYYQGVASLDLSNFDTSQVTNMASMFYGRKGLKNLNLSSFDTANVRNMASMFYNCSSLTTPNVDNFDTAQVTNMSSMFYNCSSLTTLSLDSFNTSQVTSMASMFYNCSKLTTLNLDNFETSQVTDMSSMFSNCSGLTTLDLNGFDTRKVTTMQSMFSGCVGFKTLNLEKFDTRSVRNMSYMFSGCTGLKTLDLSCFNPVVNTDSDSETSSEENELSNTKNLTDTSYMFYNCTNLTDLNLDRFYTGSVVYMHYMFSNCLSLIEIDLTDFDTKNVTNMFAMFQGSSALKDLDLSSFDASKCLNMGNMFNGCSSLKTLDVSNFNTQSARGMNSMFSGCSSLLELDLSDFYTSNVMYTYTTYIYTTPGGMDRMFSDCSSMTKLIIDKEKFNTSNVSNMQYMFFGCSRLEELDVSSFNTSKVTNMKSMFSGCNSLEELDVSNFDTSKVTDMTEMFSRCNTLTELDVSKFNTSQVRNIYGMFFLCINLKSIDVTSFDLTNVTDIHDMFYSCRNLQELDLSNFDLANVTDVWNLLSECVGLNVIYTPRNLGLTLALPKDGPDDKWFKSGSGESAIVTTMPQLDYSIMIIKNKSFEYPCIIAQKEQTVYNRGEVLTLKDLTVTYYDGDGNPTVLTPDQYTTNVDEIDMRKEEEQELRVFYHHTDPEDEPLEDSLTLYITGKIKVEISGITIEDSIYNGEMVAYQGEPVITDLTTNEILDTTEKDISLMYGYKGTLMDGTPYPYTQNGKPPVEAGRYFLVVAVEETNLYFTGTTEIPFEIKKAELTITAENVMLPQNFPQPQEYNYTVNGLFKQDTLIKEPSFQCVVDMAKPNVYDIIPNGADAGRNYEITYIGGTFTVSDKKMVEISGIEIDSITYNASPVSYKGEPVAKVFDNDGNVTEEEVTEYIGTLVYTYRGMQADGTVYEETENAPVNVGRYTLNVTVSGDNDLYMGTTKFPFEIRKAPVTITAEDMNIKVGEAIPETYHYIAEGLFSGDKLVTEPSFRCNADTSREGSYYIVPYEADAGMNYDVFYVNGLLIVKENGGLTVEDIPHQIYTGKPIKPEVRVFFDEDTLLVPGKDYTIKFFNNINADTQIETQRRIGFSRSGRGDDGFTKGMAYVMVTGKGNYAGTVYRNFYIDPVKISKNDGSETDEVVLKYTEQLIFNGKKAQKTFSSIKCKKSMKLNEDFELTLTTLKATVNGEELAPGEAFFEKGVPVIPANSKGTFQLSIKGINNYTGTIKKTVYVSDKEHLMKNAKITLGKNLKSVAFSSGGVRLAPAYYDEKGEIIYVVAESTFKQVASLNDAFTVSMRKQGLKYGADKDYTVRYKNNNKVGTATLIVEGKGEYMGTKSINFKITGSPLSATTVNFNNFRQKMIYTGKECRQDDIQLMDSYGNEILKSNYTISYKNNIKKGNASMIVTANPASGYTGTIKKTYKIMAADMATAVTIVPKDASKDSVQLKENGTYDLNSTVTYASDGVKPIDKISLLLGAEGTKPTTLVENKDYTVKYTNNTSATPSGTPTMTITGKGSLTGTLTVTFQISKAPLISREGLSITATEVPYKAKNKEGFQYQPKITITDGKKRLKSGTDYTVNEYVHCSQKEVEAYLQAKTENQSASVLQSLRPYAVVAATDGSNYTGTTEVDLTIYDTKITANTLYVVIEDDENYSKTTYTGMQVRPKVEVYYGTVKAIKEAKKAEITDSITLTSQIGKYKLKKLKLKQGQNNGDYTLMYGENIRAGKNTGSITVFGSGRYGGKVTTKFTIQGEDVFGSQVEPWSLFAEKLNLVFAQ